MTVGAIYIGNLVAFLAVGPDAAPFKTYEDVAAQNSHVFGTLGSSYQAAYLKVRSQARYFYVFQQISAFFLPIQQLFKMNEI